MARLSRAQRIRDRASSGSERDGESGHGVEGVGQGANAVSLEPVLEPEVVPEPELELGFENTKEHEETGNDTRSVVRCSARLKAKARRATSVTDTADESAVHGVVTRSKNKARNTSTGKPKRKSKSKSQTAPADVAALPSGRMRTSSSRKRSQRDAEAEDEAVGDDEVVPPAQRMRTGPCWSASQDGGEDEDNDNAAPQRDLAANAKLAHEIVNRCAHIQRYLGHVAHICDNMRGRAAKVLRDYDEVIGDV